MTTATFTFIDNSKEFTSFGVPMDEITAANHDVQVAAAATIRGNVEALTLAVLTKSTVVHSSQDFVYTVPTSAYANRETAVQFTLQGDTEPKNKVRVSLGAPDLDKFPFVAAQSDIVEVPFSGLHADLTSLISSLENFVKHPVTGEDMTVVRMEKIGRNL